MHDSTRQLTVNTLKRYDILNAKIKKKDLKNYCARALYFLHINTYTYKTQNNKKY